MRIALILALTAALTIALAACEVTNPVDPARAQAQSPDAKKEPQQADGMMVAKAGKGKKAGKRGATVFGPGKLTPDAADTAAKPPVAADLTRYTEDLTGSGRLMMEMKTTMGTLTCELYEDKAPMTVANFVGLARGLKAWKHPNEAAPRVGKPLYDGVLFHRVIPEFMIQGGDPLGVGMGGPGYKIPDEFGPGLKHTRGGLLSMANAGPNTGGSQFFLTEKETPWLDGRHAIFGACEEVDLVKRMARVPRGGQDRPNEDLKIISIGFFRG
jgi:cyclophilin family peptidyl-prolyl cis-trans isomerase